MSITTALESAFTGVREIDTELDGGIINGSLVVIEGESGAGKSVLSQHLTHGTLSSGSGTVAYYTTHKNIRSLMGKMGSLSLPVAEFFLMDWLRLYPLHFRYGREDAREALWELIDHIGKLPERFNLVVIDSVSPFMNNTRQETPLDFFFACKELCGQNRSIVMTANPHAFAKGILRRAYSLCDYYMKVRSEFFRVNAEQVSQRSIRILDVTKAHGMERSNRKGIKFEIEPQVGIQIVPFDMVKV